MAILLYLPEKNEAGARLHRIVRNILSDRNIEMFDSIDDMSQRLHEPIPDLKIAVLYLATKHDLLEIQSLSNFLWDIRLILVLPDEDPGTISQAHLLRPRFIAYADHPFDDLGVVLKQMVRIYHDSV